jgi:hypothetical protein
MTIANEGIPSRPIPVIFRLTRFLPLEIAGLSALFQLRFARPIRRLEPHGIALPALIRGGLARIRRERLAQEIAFICVQPNQTSEAIIPSRDSAAVLLWRMWNAVARRLVFFARAPSANELLRASHASRALRSPPASLTILKVE